MNTKLKIMFCLFFMIGLLPVYPLVVFSQEEAGVANPMEASEQKLSGTILSLDTEEQTIVVQYQMDAEQQTVTTALFQLAENANITKNGEEISFSMLNEGDQIILQYHVDALDNKIVDVLSIRS